MCDVSDLISVVSREVVEDVNLHGKYVCVLNVVLKLRILFKQTVMNILNLNIVIDQNFYLKPETPPICLLTSCK